MDDFFDDCNGLSWDEIAFLGALSEDIACEERDIKRIRREWDDQEDDYWDMIKRRW